MDQTGLGPTPADASGSGLRRTADGGRPLVSRRRLLRTVGAAGVGTGVVLGLAADEGALADRTRIVYANARTRPESGPFQPRTKSVPAEWHRNLTLAFEIQASIRAAVPSSLVGAFAVPGTFDEPEASISVAATDEGIGETLEDLSGGLSIDLNIVEGLPSGGDDEPTLSEAYQVSDLDERRVPSGYVCGTDGVVGTLAPALYDAGSGAAHFATSNHVFGAAGTKATEHEGEPLSILRDDETRRIGRVVRGYPEADVVRVAPEGGYRPVSAIARATPGTVIGQYTKAGLADLMAREEPLQKVGAFSNHTAGAIEGIDGVTCYTGEVCKAGQLKWGGEASMADGDSGSVSYHEDPEHPEEYVLVGGINNARTWWPGMDFTWGTGAHHLLDEYGLHF